jgi:hypothetical protein
MNHIAGTFNGTGAALYIGCGFVPDWVKVFNLEDADCAFLQWNKHLLRAAEMPRGMLMYTAAGMLGDPRTVTDGGIHPYRGGDLITSASTAYLVLDDADYKTSATYGTVNKWTLGSAANRTGNFNLEADTTYIGEGSEITIRQDFDGKIITAAIQALGSNGELANEVTLSEAVKTGDILFISRMYDFVGCAANTTMPAGFLLDATTVINVSGEMCAFEAGTFI